MPGTKSSEFQPVFQKLRSIMAGHASGLSITDDKPDRYCLEAPVGPATLKAWGGKSKRPMIPVAWVELGKSYVSYHLMGIQGNAKLQDGMSKELRARMQGKTCFNFKSEDDALFRELDQLTRHSVQALRTAGFIERE